MWEAVKFLTQILGCWITLFLTLIGVLAVIYYTYFTQKQWKEVQESNKLSAASLEMSRQSLEQSKHAFEVSQRARLRVTKFEFTELKAGPFIAKAYITNTGPLSATEVRMQATVICEAKTQSLFMEAIPRPINYFDRMGWPTRDVIGSGATKELEAKSVLDGNIARWPVFFIGRVQYLDGFEKDRTLRFCRYWNYAAQPHPTEPSASWEACFHHNWAD